MAFAIRHDVIARTTDWIVNQWRTTVMCIKRYTDHFDPVFGPGRVVVVVVVVVVISSLKIPKAFLIRSGTQRNFAYTFVLTFPADLPCQIFKLICS